MGRKARSSPWNAGRPHQSPARPRPLMSAATRRSLGGDGPRPQPPLGSPGTTGWPADGSGKWVSWIRRPVPFGQPSRGKACDLSPTHSLDRPPAANLDTGATDPCATQRRVRLEPQFPGEGTWPVDGTGDPTLFAAWRLIFDASARLWPALLLSRERQGVPENAGRQAGTRREDGQARSMAKISRG